MLFDVDDSFSMMISFILGLVYIPLLLAIARSLGLYAIVKECEAQVFTLFGK
ncbi:hypothetical protein [Chromatium okenii]|nr:hypothetical protein [Chromatium okenii]